MRKASVDFQALQNVISYLEVDEKKDYDSYDKKPKNHIWISIKKLKREIAS